MDDRFTVCANGEIQEFRCPETLHLNLVTQQCDHPENSQCTVVTVPPPPVLQCPRQGGPLFPHPTDCSKTYSCSKDDTPLVYPCREGLFFDYEQQYCAPKNVVKCFGDED